uniref:RNA-dependent RNA polymerase n=1 Tax=Shahe isopoda virus 4 TaxID=1923424 RepID=A0A1L3KPN7_9VIRU|nr:RNA-dependent RNA polymerase [Shahe isopoda virus 4]
MEKSDVRKIMVDDDEKVLMVSFYIVIAEGNVSGIVRIYYEDKYGALHAEMLSEEKRRALGNWQEIVDVLDFNGDLNVASLVTSKIIDRGANLKELFEELLKTHFEAMKNMFKREAASKDFKLFLDKKRLKEATTVFSENVILEALGSLDIRLMGDVESISDYLKKSRGNLEGFKVEIRDRVERELTNYVETMLTMACNKKFDTKYENAPLYNENEKKRFEIFRKATGQTYIYEKDINSVMNGEKLEMITNSFPNADDIVNRDFSSVSMNHLLNECKRMCKEVINSLPVKGIDGVDKMSEREILGLMNSLSFRLSSELVDKNNGLAFAIQLLEEKTKKGGNTIKQMHLGPVKIALEKCNNVYSKRAKRMYKEIVDLLKGNEGSDDRTAVEVLGRIKGLCTEALMSLIFNVNHYNDDNDKKIENMSKLSVMSSFVKSSAKNERLLITDIVKDTGDSEASRKRVEKVISNLREFGSEGVSFKLSDGFEMMSTSCFIEVGCRNRSKEKVEQDFETLSNCLKPEACFGAICFQRFRDLLRFCNRRDIVTLINQTCELFEMEEESLIKEEYNSLVAMYKSIGDLSESKLRAILREVWERDVFERTKEILGYTKISKTTYMNCAYISKANRDELIRKHNEMIMDDLGLTCEKQRGLILREKLRCEKTEMSREEIENKVIRDSKDVVRKLGVGYDGHEETIKIGNFDVNCEITKILSLCTGGKKRDVMRLRTMGLTGKNTYFMKNEGIFYEDSILILGGLSEKYKEEGLNRRDMRLKEFKKIGDLSFDSMKIRCREVKKGRKESAKNVLLELYSGKNRSNYTRTNCGKTIANMLVLNLCSEMSENDTKHLLCTYFLKRKKMNMRDVFRNIVDVAESVIVRSHRERESVLKFTRKEVYSIQSFCQGVKDLNELTESYTLDCMRKERRDIFYSAFWINHFILTESGLKKEEALQMIRDRGLIKRILMNCREIKKHLLVNQSSDEGKVGKEASEKKKALRDKVSDLFDMGEWRVSEVDATEARLMIESIRETNKNSMLLSMWPTEDNIGQILNKCQKMIENVINEVFFGSTGDLGMVEKRINFRKAFYKMNQSLFLEIVSYDNSSGVEQLNPVWQDHLIELMTDMHFKESSGSPIRVFDYSEIENKAVEMLKKAVIIPTCIGEVRDLLEESGSSEMSHKIIECELPIAKGRYIISEVEKEAEDICRIRLIGKKDNEKKIRALLRESMTEEEKRNETGNEPVVDLFDFLYEDYDGDLDVFGDEEEEEMCKLALSLDSSEIGRGVCKDFKEFKKLMGKLPMYRKSVFLRALARRLVRHKSMNHTVKGCISGDIKGFNCTLVTKRLRKENHNYEFCVYNDEGVCIGPIIINEQKLNFLISGPAVLISNFLGNIDNCSLSQEDYVRKIRDQSDSLRSDIKKMIVRILNIVQRVNILLSYTDGYGVGCFLSTVLENKGKFQNFMLRALEDTLHNNLNGLRKMKGLGEKFANVNERVLSWFDGEDTTTSDDVGELNNLKDKRERLEKCEKDDLDVYMFISCVRNICKIFRLTEDLSKRGFSGPDIFSVLFPDVTFRLLMENNASTNEQMQKTRFLIMHKMGCAGAYKDFGKKLFTEGRKSSVTLARLLQLWSVCYGCLNNNYSYLCTQSDAVSTSNMKHLISETYYNQFYCKMLLSNVESIKEVTFKVLERVVDWKVKMRDVKCPGGESCYCDDSEKEDIERQTIVNCLMCLDVYKRVSMAEEMIYCLSQQNKFASGSPKLSNLLYTHYALSNEESIKSTLKKSDMIDLNDLISMSKSTGMVEEIERSVNLSEFYKAAFWKKISSLRGVIVDKAGFSSNKSERRNLEIIKRNIDRFLETKRCKEEQEVMKIERELVDSLKKRVDRELEGLSEDDDVFKGSVFGRLSKVVFSIKKDLSSVQKRAGFRLNNVLTSVLSRVSGVRATFFKNSVSTRNLMIDRRQETDEEDDDEDHKFDQIVDFYIKNVKGIKNNITGKDVLFNNEESDTFKKQFPEGFAQFTNEETMAIIERAKKEINVTIERKPLAYSRKLKKDINLGFEDEFKRGLGKLFYSCRAMDLGMLRMLRGDHSLLKAEDIVTREDRKRWFSGNSYSLDTDDVKNVALGELVFSTFRKSLDDARAKRQVYFDETTDFDLCLCTREMSGSRTWPVFPDVKKKTVHVSKGEKEVLNLSNSEEQEHLIEVCLSFIDDNKTLIKLVDKRSSNDVCRARDIELLRRRIIEKNRACVVEVYFILKDEKQMTKVLEELGNSCSAEEREDTEIIHKNLMWLKSKLERGDEWFVDEIFLNVQCVKVLSKLFDKVMSIDQRVSKLSKEQRMKISRNLSVSRLEEGDISDSIVNEIVKEQREIIRQLIEVMNKNKGNTELFFFLGSYYCMRGLLRLQKLDSSTVPFALDIDFRAKEFFSSKEIVKCFSLICLYNKSAKEELHDLLFSSSITVSLGKDQKIDFSKTLIKKNFLYNFYEVQNKDEQNVKEGIKRKINFKTKNAKKSKGAYLIAKKVFGAKENMLTYNEMIKLISDKENLLKHQTTIAPKNQLGAARDLKVQTLDSCILQSSIEMISSDVFKSMKRNTITNKYCKSQFLSLVEKVQKDISKERNHYFMSKDGESWGPKMKGGHIIRGNSRILRELGFEELADVCDVISEVWDNRETEISGVVVDGYMRTMINKRLDLEMGLDALLDKMFSKEDDLNRYLFTELYKGRKVVTLPIHMGQGLLQSTSTGIQAVISNFLDKALKKIDRSCSKIEMIAGSDDSALTVTMDSDGNLKRLVDIIQVVTSSLNVNDSCKSSISKKVLEFHSVFVCDGEQIPAKEKFNSSILFVGKDSSLKGFFESTYNLLRQLISNSGDLTDVFSTMVGRVSSILGTFNTKQKRLLLECLSGPISWGGLPPFEIINYAVMRKEDFTADTRLMCCLKKLEKNESLRRVEKAVLVNSFLESKREYETGTIFLNKISKREDRKLEEVCEMEPIVEVDDDVRNFIDFAMKQNKVSNKRIDVLRMKQVLWSMKTSGSLRNEDNLNVLHQFHLNGSHDCVIIKYLPESIGSLIQKAKQGDPMTGRVMKYELCGIEDMLKAYETVYNERKEEIKESIRMMGLSKKSHCRRLLKLFETRISKENTMFSKMLYKVALFDRRSTNITNTALNTILWHVDKDTMRDLGIKRLDEMEIYDDFLRIKLMSEDLLNDAVAAVKDLRMCDRKEVRERMMNVELLISRIENKPTSFFIYVGMPIKGYHRAGDCFYQTCSFKGKCVETVSDTLPEFVGNSFRGVAKEVLGFLSSLVPDTLECKRLIREAYGKRLSPEEERDLECRESIIGCLKYSKVEQDVSFLNVHKKVIENELIERFEESDSIVSHQIYYYDNKEKTVLDFVLNGGAALRLYNLDSGMFFYGCKVSNDDLKRVMMKSFEVICKCSTPLEIARRLRRMKMFDCSADTPRVKMIENGSCFLARDGIPYFEDANQTDVYQSGKRSRNLVRSSVEKRKYGFVLVQEIYLMKSQEEEANEAMSNIEAINMESRGVKRELELLSQPFKIDTIRIPHIGSKTFSDAVVKLCVKLISEDSSVVVRLRKGYGDSFNSHIEFIERGETKSSFEDRQKISLKLRDALIGEEYVKSRYGVDVRVVAKEQDMEVTYTRKEKEEALIETNRWERCEKSLDVVLDKIIRDIYILDVLKEAYTGKEMSYVLGGINTGFVKELQRMKNQGLSRMVSYFLNFYDLEKATLRGVYSARRYVEALDEFLEKLDTMLLYERQAKISSRVRGPEKEIEMSKNDEKLLNRQLKNKTKLKSDCCAIWKNLAGPTQNEISGVYTEMEVVLSKCYIDLEKLNEKGEKRKEELKKAIQKEFESVTAKIDKFLDLFFEVLLLDSLSKFDANAKARYLGKSFCKELEDEKAKINGILWPNCNIYPKVERNSVTGQIICRICLKTGLKYETNCIIRYLLSEESSFDILSSMVEYSRAIREAKRVIRRMNKDRGWREDSKVIEEKNVADEKREKDIVDWYDQLDEETRDYEVASVLDSSGPSTFERTGSNVSTHSECSSFNQDGDESDFEDDDNEEVLGFILDHGIDNHGQEEEL